MAVLYMAGNLAFVYSVTHTAVANTLFFISATPLFAALIAWLVLRQQVERRTWVAIGFAGLGIAIICLGKPVMPHAGFGNLAGLFAALCLAAGFTLVSIYRDRTLLPGLVLGGLVTALLLEPFVQPSGISDANLSVLFLMGFVMLPIASTLMYIGPKFISATEVGLIMLLESLAGPVWVWMVLGENPGALALVGGGILLVTLAVHALSGFRAAAPRPVAARP